MFRYIHIDVGVLSKQKLLSKLRTGACYTHAAWHREEHAFHIFMTYRKFIPHWVTVLKKVKNCKDFIVYLNELPFWEVHRVFERIKGVYHLSQIKAEFRRGQFLLQVRFSVLGVLRPDLRHNMDVHWSSGLILPFFKFGF